VPVHIVKENGAAFYHLQTGQPGTVINQFFGQFLFQRPDFSGQPLHQFQIIAITPEKGHRGMTMTIIETRNHRLARTLDHLISSRSRQLRGDLADQTIFQQNINRHSIQNHLPQQQTHSKLLL